MSKVLLWVLVVFYVILLVFSYYKYSEKEPFFVVPIEPKSRVFLVAQSPSGKTSFAPVIVVESNDTIFFFVCDAGQDDNCNTYTVGRVTER